MTAYFNTAAGGAVLAQLDALKALANSGRLQIWTDAQVSGGKDPDVAFSGTKLAEFTFNNPAFGADSAGGTTFPTKTQVTTASFVSSTVTALASGTALTFGITNSAGTTIYAAGSVGTSGADINFNSNVFSIGANVTLSSFTLTMPE